MLTLPSPGGRCRLPARSKRAQGSDHVRRIFAGLRAGDLRTILLSMEMAADENRLPTADPEETTRILAFLVRLSRLDAGLPRRKAPLRAATG